MSAAHPGRRISLTRSEQRTLLVLLSMGAALLPELVGQNIEGQVIGPNIIRKMEEDVLRLVQKITPPAGRQ